MLKVDHIGIAVRDLAQSVALFEKLLDSSCYKTEALESEKVNTAFFIQGETKIELVQSTDAEGVVAKYIQNKGEGLHHLAFAVADLETEMRRLEAEGFQLLDRRPRQGADNKWVCFLHPKNIHGVLIELCMDQKEKQE
jgi:methylmalonyl-CoA/ethylmalonyl-CoA epimerase